MMATLRRHLRRRPHHALPLTLGLFGFLLGAWWGVQVAGLVEQGYGPHAGSSDALDRVFVLAMAAASSGLGVVFALAGVRLGQ